MEELTEQLIPSKWPNLKRLRLAYFERLLTPCRLVLLESSKKPILTGPRATRLFKSAKLIVRYLNLKRLRVAGFKAPRDTKGSGSRAAWLTMVFKLALAAEKRWRRLNGNALLADVIRGVRFVDGIKELAP